MMRRDKVVSPLTAPWENSMMTTRMPPQTLPMHTVSTKAQHGVIHFAGRCRSTFIETLQTRPATQEISREGN